MKLSTRKEKGFSLIELLVVLMVIGFFLRSGYRSH